jgi:hypothetical protein
MGILATHPTIVPGEKIIVSLDKDMKQIPGKLYNPGKKTLRTITRRRARSSSTRRCSRAIPWMSTRGAPAWARRPPRILLHEWDSEPLSPWTIVVDAYKSKGLTEADALVQARVAKILQHTDYNFRKKEPILWTPVRPEESRCDGPGPVGAHRRDGCRVLRGRLAGAGKQHRRMVDRIRGRRGGRLLRHPGDRLTAAWATSAAPACSLRSSVDAACKS